MTLSDDIASSVQSRPATLDSREALLDPYPWYAEMREREVLPYDAERDRYMAFRYDVVKSILADTEAFTAEEPPIVPGSSVLGPINKWFVNQDPPEHDRLRRSVEPYFRHDYLEENFHDRIEQLASELLDNCLKEHGPEFDYVQDYAIRIPTAIIADMIGVPREKWSKFREWSQGIVAPGPEYVGGMEPEVRQRKLTEWITYFNEFIDDRRDDPQDDMISDLIAYEDRDGQPLTDADIVSILALLNIAGNVTTTSLLSNTMRSLAKANYIDNAVSGDIDVKAVVEETLRYRSSLQETDRITTQEVEIQGRVVPSNTIIELWIGAANRDPRQFDDPETFVPERDATSHIAFGHGLHHCLGATLARMEATISLKTFFDRFSAVDVHLDEAEPQLTLIEYGLESLPVTVEVET